MIYLTNTCAGRYGVPGVGPMAGGETRAVPLSVAARHWQHPELRVEITDPLIDLPLRNTATGTVDKLGYFGPVDSRFGYGGAGINILRALTSIGIDAAVYPHYDGGHTSIWPKDIPPDAQSQLVQRDWLPQLALNHCLPDDLKRCPAPRKWCWTMWETDQIPRGTDKRYPFGDWAAEINQRAERLIVPCAHNAKVFGECGVEVPIDVLPYGIDTDVWPYCDRRTRPAGQPFTVVLFGDLTSRKAPEEAVDAFQLAFPNNADVRLVLKTQNPAGLPRFAAVSSKFNDPRISVLCESWSRQQLVEWLWSADCYLFLGRGEGYSLTQLQAAATGLPVITTMHSGMGAYATPRHFYTVGTTGMSQSPMGGRWYEPDVEAAAKHLRRIYQNPAAAFVRAQQTAHYVRRQFSLAAFAQRLHTYIEAHA